MLRTATPEYARAVVGAFAFTHIGHLFEHGKRFVISWHDVDQRDPYFNYVGGYHPAIASAPAGTVPLRVDVQVPWRGPDPRGPGKESMRQAFVGGTGPDRYRMVQERYPCDVGTVIPLDLTPGQLQQHALAARARLDVELDRGYGVLHAQAPPPDRYAAERKLLPEHASHCQHGLPRVVTEALWEEVTGELVDDLDDVRGITRDTTSPAERAFRDFRRFDERSIFDRDQPVWQAVTGTRPPYMPPERHGNRIYIDPDALEQLLHDPEVERAAHIDPGTLARLIDRKLGLGLGKTHGMLREP